MNPAASLPPGSRSSALPRVLVVDDSAVVRGLVARWIEADPRLALAGTCADGEQGVKRAKELQPDLVVLDIEMPRMDGLTALPQILAAAPRARVVMASTLTHKGAQVTLQALSLGAADFAPKPDTSRMGGAESYRVELLDKLAVLAPRYAPQRPASSPGTAAATPPLAASSAAPAVSGRALPSRIDLLAIGASTGGPQALRQVISVIPASIRVPIVITQHMPKVFTAILAEHLAREGLPAHEAAEGEVLKPGHVYVAPGDFHMRIEGSPGQFRVRLDQGPAVNFCRPSVDPLFESCARAAGSHLLAVVLTGMGSDGRTGAGRVREAGGGVIVQDQASSVVWGMPGAVVEAGLADLVLPLNQIGPDLARRLTGAR